MVYFKRARFSSLSMKGMRSCSLTTEPSDILNCCAFEAELIKSGERLLKTFNEILRNFALFQGNERGEVSALLSNDIADKKKRKKTIS
jgi:hypothetical protein